jgi:hypothetical protein
MQYHAAICVFFSVSASLQKRQFPEKPDAVLNYPRLGD